MKKLALLVVFAAFAAGCAQDTKNLEKKVDDLAAKQARGTAPVRIESLHDAQVFARRWVIRDKDPALKVLVRRLERARSGEGTENVFGELRSALAVRGLLRQRPLGETFTSLDRSGAESAR